MADDGELGPASGGGEGATGPTAHTGGGNSGAGGGGPGGGNSSGNGPTAHTGGADRITIFINNTEYQVDEPSMTGADLKRLAKEPMNRMVVWIKGGPHGGPGRDGETVLDDQSISLVSGMEFRIVNAGTFGGTSNRIMPDARHLQPPRTMPQRPGEVP